QVGVHAQSIAGDPGGGAVTYELSVNPSNFFQIDPTTGVVSLAVDASNLVAPSYDIKVVAKDTSGLARGTSTESTFKIRVQGPGVAAPTDGDGATANEVSEAATGVPEDFIAPITSTYTGVQAFSASATSYSISNDTSGGGFQIDPTTGKI